MRFQLTEDQTALRRATRDLLERRFGERERRAAAGGGGLDRALAAIQALRQFEG